ncbi:MAG: hypothetical protein ABW123_01285 [Cystobacter sp.]
MKPTRSRQRHYQGGRALGWGALACALLSGCETYFVDPHAPELDTVTRQQVVKTHDAPLVYGLIFDLNIPDNAECQRVKASLSSTLRAALLPPGREGMELPARDLSPGCVQGASREYFSSIYDADSRMAELRFGPGRVKPVLFYFNNVNLPLPDVLRQTFESLQQLPELSAEVWALAAMEALLSTRFSQSAPWTYSTDPRLLTQFLDTARAQLPFIEFEPSPPEGHPLFTARELSGALEFKGCTPLSGLSGLNFPYGPTPVRVDRSRPPRFLVDVPHVAPQPRGAKLEPVTFRFSLEVCRSNCERFAYTQPDHAFLAWNATPRCFVTDNR